MKNKPFYPALVLFAVASLVALVLAGVNLVTKEPIRLAAEEQKRRAISAIFVESDGFRPVDTALSEGISAAYSVYSGSELLGYAIEVAQSGGYGGVIYMTVGVTADLKIAGVEITDHGETAGLGSKIEGEGFRSSFKGQSHPVSYESIDAISGATISSKAAVAGANAALEFAKTIVGGGK